ncbi:MAG TPA: nucleotide sugar dehydrogenase [Solirubrobacteraceae bacterium]|nr:nucleotide sugar dehydrogenase [Solirubrobacteraceae bacterium]
MKIGIIGLGYVGLPLAVAFAEAGHDIVGVDNDSRRASGVAAGRSHVEDIADERLAAVVGRIETTTRMARLARVDAIIICVPTPLTANGVPDLSALIDAVSGVAGILQAGQLVVLESTTYPGTTRDRVAPILGEAGLVVGRDYNLAFSPERIDPGRTDYTLRTTPKVVGGVTAACGDRTEALYREVCDHIVRVSTPEAAELTKLLENIFRSVNIALVNELWMLADRMGIDIHEVVEAADTKPYGFMRFDPGPGMGGHCLPVDPFYLTWKAREYGLSTEFIELAGKVNHRMPDFCVDKIQRTLNDLGKPTRGARVLVVGVAYKPGVGDVRESPALRILAKLDELGARLSYHDPYVPELAQLALRNAPLATAAESADVAVIVTAHPGVPHEAIADIVPTVDLRAVLHKPLRGSRDVQPDATRREAAWA